MNNCDFFHCATGVTVGTDAVVLTFSSPAIVADKDRFCFKLCQSIPETGANLPVQITVNGTTLVPLWNKYGNPILGGQLRNRKYVGYYGATVPHVILTNTPITYGNPRIVY